MRTLGESKGRRHSAAADQAVTVDPAALAVRWLPGGVCADKQHSTQETELGTKTFWIEEGYLPLKVHKPLKLLYEESPDGDFLTVVGWDIKVPLAEANRLLQEVPRKFLELYSKGQQGRLSSREKEILSFISDCADYREFWASRRPLVYKEARLVRKTPVLLLDFSTGQSERLKTDLLKKLNVLQEGDYFSAFYKLGREGEVVDLERVELLADPLTLSDDFWELQDQQ